MPISYNSCLASEVFHFYVKYHATTNMLVNIRYELSIRHDTKGNLHTIHILGNCIDPKCVIVLLIKLMSFDNFLGEFNAKFLVFFKYMVCSFCTIEMIRFSFLEGMSHPPVEC